MLDSRKEGQALSSEAAQVKEEKRYTAGPGRALPCTASDFLFCCSSPVDEAYSFFRQPSTRAENFSFPFSAASRTSSSVRG